MTTQTTRSRDSLLPVPRAQLLEIGLTDAQVDEALGSAPALAEWLNRAGRGEERERILAFAQGMPNWWCMRPQAAPSDADLVLRQSLALHRRAGALHRDLKLAEQSLAAEPNELNLARLLDIKANLADPADAEAAIDGFGDQSGRASSAM